MIADLKPYQKYKESGSRWLSAVPAHWEVRNLRTLLTKRTERNRADLPLLSVAREKGVFVRSLTDENENHNFIPEDLTNYKVARAGNLVINKMKAWQGSMGIAPCDGIVSPAYFVFDFRISNHGFGQALLRSKPYVAHFGQASDGVRVGQWDLSIPGMRQIPILVPPKDEQDAIVRFLSHANYRIQKAIQAKHRIIALLNEQQQAIIHQALSRGFVEHLPVNILCLPKEVRTAPGWQSFSVRRLIQLRLLAIQDGNHGELHPKASDYVDDGIPFLMANNVRPEGLDLSGCAKLHETHARTLRIGFAHAGDVLLTHKATIGQIGRVPEDLKAPFVMLTPQVTYYRTTGTKILGDYLFHYMQSPLFQKQLKMLSLNQSTRPYVGVIEQKNLIICFPSLENQQRICAEIRSSIAPVEAARSRIEREVDLLIEYRARLVADVVTGKLDVREAVANLPEETPTEAKALHSGDAPDETKLVDEEAAA